MVRSIPRLASVGIVFLVLLVACTAKPIYNVENETIVAKRPVTMEEVERIIKRSALRRGWIVKDLGPGKIEARLHLREHVAVVDIAFDTKKYSITYKDSQKLDYDGTQIHQNYNSWIRFLRKDINLDFGLL